MNADANLSAILTLYCRGCTVADLEEFLRSTEQFDLGDDYELLDGPGAGVAGEPGVPDIPEMRTVGDLRTWVGAIREAQVDGNTTIVGVDAVGVDLPVIAIEVGFCGDHIGTSPAQVFIQTHPTCAQHLPTTDSHTAR